MFRTISSLANANIKRLVQLRNNNQRRKLYLTLVDGKKEVECAMASKRHEIVEIYICRDLIDPALLEKLSKFSCLKFEVTAGIMQKICYGGRNEGVLIVVKYAEINLDDLPKKKNRLYLVIEAVEKPGNLGAILRTADGSGVDAVIVCDQKTDVFNPNAVRASLGSVFTAAVVQTSNQACFDYLKRNKFNIVATALDAKKNYTKPDYTRDTAFILGSEHEGISDFWQTKSDETVKIPMKGVVDSLNVSASTAVMVYEALRQRG